MAWEWQPAQPSSLPEEARLLYPEILRRKFSTVTSSARLPMPVKNALALMTSRTPPKSRKPCKLGTQTCLATTQTKDATTRRMAAERSTTERLDKGIKDTKLALLSSPTNPTSILTRTPSSNAAIQTNSNRTPTNNPERSKRTLSTTADARHHTVSMHVRHKRLSHDQNRGSRIEWNWPDREERIVYLPGHRLHRVHQNRLTFRLFHQIQSHSQSDVGNLHVNETRRGR